MLQTIGKHIQGWIAGVVIAIVAAAFILLGLEYYINRSGQDVKSAATVNGVKIYPEQVNNAYEALLQTYTQQGKTINEQAQQQLRYMALEQLILDQVLLQTASKLGLTVSSMQVRQAVMQIPDFQENGKFSPEKFQQLLSQNNIPPEAFLTKFNKQFLPISFWPVFKTAVLQCLLKLQGYTIYYIKSAVSAFLFYPLTILLPQLNPVTIKLMLISKNTKTNL